MRVVDTIAVFLYRLGGVSHILAISGLHITLLGVGFYQLLRKLRLPLRASGLLAALFLIAYAILTGGSVATLRALIMFLLYLLSKAAFRVYDVPTALAVAAILLLLENPLYLFYAGFQLSFTAVLALAAFPGHGRFFSGLILYLITVPFTLWHYFSLPLYGVFSARASLAFSGWPSPVRSPYSSSQRRPSGFSNGSSSS